MHEAKNPPCSFPSASHRQSHANFVCPSWTQTQKVGRETVERCEVLQRVHFCLICFLFLSCCDGEFSSLRHSKSSVTTITAYLVHDLTFRYMFFNGFGCFCHKNHSLIIYFALCVSLSLWEVPKISSRLRSRQVLRQLFSQDVLQTVIQKQTQVAASHGRTNSLLRLWN